MPAEQRHVAPGTGSSGGWYITGVTGGIGAAAAVGRVLGFDRGALVSAMGLAAAQSCGTRGTHASMACAYVPAVAAQAGFTAAMMAHAGFECGAAAVAGRNGVVEVIAPKADHDAICRDFGHALGTARQRLQALSVRDRHPSGHRCVSRAGAQAQARRDEIESVAFDVNPGALALCWRKLPNSELEAQVSLFHWLAAALVKGEADSRAGATRLHPGSGGPRACNRAYRYIRPEPRYRSGQSHDAHARRHVLHRSPSSTASAV